jgi:hypothetical protein
MLWVNFFTCNDHVNIFTECDGRKYGVKCQEDCGYCLELEQCHHINGTCLRGCNPGYKGLPCNESKSESGYQY